MQRKYPQKTFHLAYFTLYQFITITTIYRETCIKIVCWEAQQYLRIFHKIFTITSELNFFGMLQAILQNLQEFHLKYLFW